MDEQTLLAHKAHWTTEQKPSNAVLKHLHPDEAALYAILKQNHFGENIRLEQEYIQYDALERYLQLNNGLKFPEPLC